MKITKGLLILFLMIFMLHCPLLKQNVQAQDFILSPDQQSAQNFLKKKMPGLEIIWNTKLKTPYRVKGIHSETLELKPEIIMDHFVNNFGSLYQIKDPAKEIQAGPIKTNSKGFISFTLFQKHNNVPVYGISLKLRIDQKKRLQSIVGKWIPKIDVNTKPKINKDQAKDSILTYLKKQYTGKTPLPKNMQLKPDVFKLVIFNPGIYSDSWTANYLSYHVIIKTQVFFVDAQTGKILYTYSNIQDIKDRATYNSDSCYDLPGTLIINEAGPVGGVTPDAETQNAHNFAGDVYDYFWDTHERDSYDTMGSAIVSTVHSGVPLDIISLIICCLFDLECCGCLQANAAWIPSLNQVVYGDGGTLDDGRSFNPFTNALDVIAHEITHGVTTNSIFDSAGDPVGLDYSGQSGALNESYSDFFGAMVDRDDWLIGEDLVIAGYPAGAMRNLADPTNAGSYDPADPEGSAKAGHQPDHMDNYVAGGDVHINSGIHNKVAYLISEGGVHPHSGINVTGMGREAAEKILYHTLTNKLTQTSSFFEAREGTLDSVEELFPGDAAKFAGIWNAFIACGICYPAIPGDCEPYAPFEERDPVDIVLLLDYSDSMNSAAEPGGRDKIDVLKDAAEIFLRTWEVFAMSGDRTDIVYFDSDVSPTTINLQPLLGNVNTIIEEIRTRPSGMYTAMGGALQVSLQGLSSGASHPSIILFTNGIQNVNPMIVQVGDHYEIINSIDAWGGSSSVPENPGISLASYGIPAHVIGIGEAAATSYHELLDDIRTETGGLLHLTTSPDTDLRRFYLDDLVAALNLGTLEMVDFKYGTLQPNQTASENFFINGTITRAAFIVHWVDKPGIAFPSLKIDGPQNTNLQPTRQIKGKFYSIAIFDFPYKVKGKIIPRSGMWKVTMDKSQNSSAVPYQATLLVDETVIHYSFGLPQKRLWTGDPIVLTVKIRESERAITDLAVQAELAYPRTSLGTFLSTNAYKRTEDKSDLHSNQEQNKLIGLLKNRALRVKLLPRMTILKLFDDGKANHGDLKKGDGIYSTKVSNTKLPGLYRFNIIVEGETSTRWPIKRIQTLSTIVRLKPNPNKTQIVTKLIKKFNDGSRTVLIKITPFDEFGNYLGPGYSQLMYLSVKGGDLLGDLQDNLDGSYLQMAKIKPNTKGTIIIDVLGTQIEKPLQPGFSFWNPWQKQSK